MITETGYYRPTFDDITEDLVLKAKELWGEDIETDDTTFLGKLIELIAYGRAKDHENAEAIYYSGFPNTAIYTGLDRLCPLSGTRRNVATPARYIVKVTGESGTTIPFGFLVATESGIEFYNTSEVTIAEEETTCEIIVECTIAGTTGNVTVSDITEVINPEAGIESIEGVNVVVAGEDEESDYNLRMRLSAIGEGSGSCNESSIRGALLRVPTVTSAQAFVNNSDEADELGTPPHSIACYVAGGEDYQQEIGQAIFKTAPCGIPLHGTITVNVVDEGGFNHEIKYNEFGTVHVSVKVSVATSVYFEGEKGKDEIKENIKNHIDKLGFGNDVVLTELYGFIYSVKGVEKVPSLTLSTDGITYNTNDVDVSSLECALCVDVEVTEV